MSFAVAASRITRSTAITTINTIGLGSRLAAKRRFSPACYWPDRLPGLPPSPGSGRVVAASTDKGYIRYSGLNYAHWNPAVKPTNSKEKLAARNSRYDYEYSDEELLSRVKGQVTLLKKTSGVAIAFNNHYSAKAVRNAIKNIKMLREKLANPQAGG